MPVKKNKFQVAVNALSLVANQFDKDSNQTKKKLLQSTSRLALSRDKYLVTYHDILLFLCAYPGDYQLKRLAEKELDRIILFGKHNRSGKSSLPENEGLPFGHTITRFSPDFLSWLLMNKNLRVEFDSFYNATLSLNDILNITLPATLKAETTAGLNNADLLEVLHIQPRQYVPFILGQLEQLRDRPILKELFIERMDLYVRLVPKNEAFSRARNRIKTKQVYYHSDLIKQVDRVQIVNESFPKPRLTEKNDRVAYRNVIKSSMALTVREIDPASFLEDNTLRIFQLERGLEFTIYSMTPNRQLPLETYFGFTLFKNGIPVSYGGFWVFGKMGKIGLNIFEPFRGGESGYLLCQLLRALKQVLGVSYVEIEPYQFGLDNPDGIASGAFWFYYKFGFRPVDKALKQLSDQEYHKIKTRKNYRSTAKTLLRFTESNIGINLEVKMPLNVITVTGKILSMMKANWQHNYGKPKLRATEIFCKQVKLERSSLTATEMNVLEDIALWAMAMKITKPKQLQLMKQMVLIKTKDDFAYQRLLLEFFTDDHLA